MLSEEASFEKLRKHLDLIQDPEDQSILCTAESSAGKTKNKKKVI